MLYSTIAETFEKIEGTTKRLEMTDYLVELFKRTPPELMDRVIYLTQGKIYPDYMGIELGIAEKLLLKALHEASGIPEKEIEELYIQHGDVGVVAEDVIRRKKQMSLFSEELTVERVYSTFVEIAQKEGKGAQDFKVKRLANLFHDSKPIEARYLSRMAVARLRLGIADMTILDALAIAFGDKSDREKVERAYNICSDLGLVARTVAEKGIEGLREIRIQVGIPIRAMLAERLKSLGEILEKMGGKAAFEYKYDGIRIQAHIGDETKLFSRHLENLTEQFPDIVEALREAFKGKNGIFEGEAVPVDLSTGEMLPFQVVSRRRGRKYGVKEAMEEYPVVIFLFDALYLNDEDLTVRPYLERREALKSSFEETDRVKISTILITDKVEEAERFFNEAIDVGCEGIMAKSISDDSIYKAGARGFLWIKYKKDYKSEMTDTVDLVPVGAFMGRGRRAGKYGALLMAAYNPDRDMFETVCKLGSGFTDEDLERLPEIFKPYLIEERHPRVDSKMEPDVWFVPNFVLEVLGAEITLSPNHTCAYNRIKEGAGLAIRFPRFTGNWRDDRGPEDATTTEEMVRMYEMQLKKVE